MALNDQILDELKKALAKVQATSTSRQSWQEQFDRQPVVSPDYIQAAKALEGFAGSWAAQAAIAPSNDELLTYAQDNGIFAPQLVTSHLGRPGIPETNFPLYARGTNKDDEPAFLGHPISFSIVGPTLRHPTNNWQWVYGVNGNGEETLTLSASTYDGSTAIVTNIDEIFGINAVPDGGLYFVVSQTGSPAEIDNGLTVQGGVGDGYVTGNPLEDITGSGRYEIFRINDISGAGVVLEKSKRLSDYFNIPAVNPTVRGITLFKPYVTRLASVPNYDYAGVNKNKVFLTITPEVSANGDLYPAYGASPTSDKTWQGGNFTDYDTNLEAPAAAYGGEAKLPVFTPKGKGVGRIQTNRYQPADGLPFEAGVLKVTDHTGTVGAGDVICIHNVSQMNSDYGEMHTVYEAFNASRGKHYYEVLSVEAGPPPHLRCKALPQVDTNGNIFYGPVVMDATIDLDGVPVQATGGVQVRGTAVLSANTNYTITITNDRDGFSQTYTANGIVGDSAKDISDKLTTQINLSPPTFPWGGVGALSQGAGNNATVTLSPTSGIYGNWIGISVSASPPLATDPLLYRSGSRLGTDVDQTAGYTSAFATAPQVRGHGIGVNDYFLQANYTIHDNVSSLFTSPVFDAAKVQKNRLDNLIDPTWTQNALSKLQSVVSSQVAVSAGRADKAIFDTSVGPKGAANPGSLLDLGFRMVLYPAKDDGGGNAIPDFDQPITTQNVILDPAINESQYLYIDYASGAVVCSHTPDPTSPYCTIAPNGIIGGAGTNNPRNEIVLFAACVPFSRMPDQTSGGLRLLSTQTVKVPTATVNSNSYADEGIGSQDVLGNRIVRNVATLYAGVAQVLQSQIPNQSLYLTNRDTIAYGSSLSDDRATIEVLVNPAIGVDTLTFWLGTTAYQITLTAAAAAGLNDFVVGINTVFTAGNIAAKINSDTRINQILHAIWDGSTNEVYIYTRRVGAQVDTSDFFPFAYAESDPFRIISSNAATLNLPRGAGTLAVLNSDSYESELPQSGWFDVLVAESYEPALRFTDPDNIVRRVATFSYSGKRLVWDNLATGANRWRTELMNVFGGSVASDDIDFSAARCVIAARKADVLPNDPKGNTGTPFQLDTTEGSSARFSKIKFGQGALEYENGVLTLDLSGDFVKKRGDTMSGALTIAIDTTLNPSEANKNGLTATGNGTGYGVVGTNGTGAFAGVYGYANPATNAAGVLGQGAGTGPGIVGLAETGTSSVGVAGQGATPNGHGVFGNGVGSGNGVRGFGGTSTGVGVEGFGGSTALVNGGAGVKGTGAMAGAGFDGGNGVEGYGAAGGIGGTDGYGVYGEGARGADGVYGLSGSVTNLAGVRGVGLPMSDNAGVIGVGDGTGAGVKGTSAGSGPGVLGLGNGFSEGVRGEAGVGSSLQGVRGLGDGTGAGVHGDGGTAGGAGVYGAGGSTSGYGVEAVGTTTGEGVNATGARGVVASSNAIANYPQAQLTAQGNALPLLANRQKGDLWFPSANGGGGEDWNGHLLIYDGTNYLDAYANILSTHTFLASNGASKLGTTGNYAPTSLIETMADPSNLPMAAAGNIASTQGLFGSVTVTASAPHGLVAGDFVFIAGAFDPLLNNSNLPSPFVPPCWRVTGVLGLQFFIAPPAFTPGLFGASGTFQKVVSHPMEIRSYTQSGGGGNGDLRFGHTIQLPYSYKGLSSVAASTVFTVYHRLSAVSLGSTFNVVVGRFRKGENYPVVASVASGNYGTGFGTFVVATPVTVTNITTSVLGATPFQQGDIVHVYLYVNTVFAGCTVSFYDFEFTFGEAFYASY